MKRIFLAHKTVAFVTLLLFLFALLTRIPGISSIPANINPDAADTLQTYLQLKYNSNSSPFAFNWNGAPAFNTYIIGFFWEIFDKSILGLRFASILFSSLTVASSFLLFYLLTKRLILSFLISLSLSCNPWFLNFSRDAWENIFNSFFLNLIIIGIILYFYQRKILIGLLLIIAGSVLGFYGYHPGKFFIIPPLLLIIINTLKQSNFKSSVRSMAILSFIFLLLTFPQMKSMIEHKEKAFGRISTVSVFNGNNPVGEILKNTTNTFKGFILFDIKSFNENSNYNHRYLPPDHPPIQLLFLPFFLIGLILSLKAHTRLLFTFFILLFPVQIFSHGAPDASRGVHIIPLIYLFIVIGIHYVLSLPYQLLRKLVLVCILGSVLYLIPVDINIYLSWISNESTLSGRQPAVENSQFPLWIHTQENEISQGKNGFNVSEWNTMMQSINDKGESSKEIELKK